MSRPGRYAALRANGQLVGFVQAAADILADLRRAIERGLRVENSSAARVLASLTDTLDWLNLWEANTDLGSSSATGYDTAPNYFTLQL
jgi:hypothetical protein